MPALKRKVSTARPKVPASKKHTKDDLDSDISSDSGDWERMSEPLAASEEQTIDKQLQALPFEEQRLRLAKHYLSQLGLDAPSAGHSLLTLPNSFDTRTSNTLTRLATSTNTNREFETKGVSKHFRGHHKPVTCAILYSSAPITTLNTSFVYTPPTKAFSGGKDGAIILWDLPTGTKTVLANAHTHPVLALATSPEHRNILCSSGGDHVIRLWDIRLAGKKSVAVLKGHKQSVTAICAEPSSEFDLLFSGSLDNVVKIWSFKTQSCMNSLYGHTSGVLSMDTMKTNRFLTVGEDGSARIWKVREETQLVFKHPLVPLDACALLNDKYFVTGSQDGNLTLWSISSRKPLFVVSSAHMGRWITALVSVKQSDIILSASDDGYIRVWKLEAVFDPKAKERSKPTFCLREIKDKKLAVCGIVTSMHIDSTVLSHMSKDAVVAESEVTTVLEGTLIVTVAKEHRLGRWVCVQDSTVKNGVLIIPFSIKAESISKLE